MWQNLPSIKRLGKKAQATQEAQVRFDQTHGAVLGQARGSQG